MKGYSERQLSKDWVARYGNKLIGLKVHLPEAQADYKFSLIISIYSDGSILFESLERHDKRADGSMYTPVCLPVEFFEPVFKEEFIRSQVRERLTAKMGDPNGR